jgi:hypothetical protein
MVAIMIRVRMMMRMMMRMRMMMMMIMMMGVRRELVVLHGEPFPPHVHPGRVPRQRAGEPFGGGGMMIMILMIMMVMTFMVMSVVVLLRMIVLDAGVITMTFAAAAAASAAPPSLFHGASLRPGGMWMMPQDALAEVARNRPGRMGTAATGSELRL